MGIFSKKRTEPPAGDQHAEIEAFWAWWIERGAGRWAAVIDGNQTLGDAVAELSDRVEAIDPRLTWEFSSGTDSRHRLVVTAEGDPEVRALAVRWLRAAPPTDPVWAYLDTRPPVATPEETVIEVAGVTVDLARVSVGVTRRGTRLDVTVHHPAFGGAEAGFRTTTSFLALDAALGEAATEIWIGEIEASPFAPLDGLGLAGLRATVTDLATEFSGADGEPSWILMEGQGPNGPRMARAQVPLSPVTAPLLTEHVLVTAHNASSDDAGMSTGDPDPTLDVLEDALARAAGGDARLVAVETGSGTRLFHLFVDPTTEARTRLERAAHDWSHRTQVSAEPDPAWRTVSHLRP